MRLVRRRVDEIARDPALFRYWIRRAAKITGRNADPEDVVAKAFARALLSASTFKLHLKFDPWFATIIKSVAWRESSNRVRVERHEVHVADSAMEALDEKGHLHWGAQAPEAPKDPEDVRETPEWATAARALQSLPDSQRELLSLYYLDSVPIVDIAAMYTVNEGRRVTTTAIIVRLQRARAALRIEAVNTA